MKMDVLMPSFKSAAVELGYSDRVGRSALQAYVLQKDGFLLELSVTTLKKYKKIALQAGFEFPEIESTSTLTRLPEKPIEMIPVNSWEEVMAISKKSEVK